MMRMALMLLPILAAGCATMPAPEPERGACVVDEAAKMRFAGVKFRERLRGEIQRATHSSVSRVLRPGDAATMDFRAERLSIMVDDFGQIDGLRCG